MTKFIIAAIAALTISTAANATDYVGLCLQTSELAENIMKGRQMGVPKEIKMAAADTSESELVNELARNLVEYAYQFPIKDTKAEKDELVEIFGAEQYETCKSESWVFF